MSVLSLFRKLERAPWFKTIVTLRSGALLLIAHCLSYIITFGNSAEFVALGGIIGVVLASYGARSQLRWSGAAVGLIALWCVTSGMFYGADFLLSGVLESSFAIPSLELQIGTFLMALSLGFASTWYFWRVKSSVTVEALVLGAVAVGLFAAHRNFRFDRPKIINSLAWQLNLSPLSTLMVVGSSLLTLAVVYLFLASRAHAAQRNVQSTPLRRQVLLWAVEIAVVVGAGYWIQQLVYNHFSQIMIDRVSNGVGMGSEAGVSPLSFQSALGSSNQPAALVRLEGDYTSNPFSPMIFLRESALSAFNGHELVFSGRAYDTDLPVVTPNESFTGKEDPELLMRTPVVQSFYLLANHDNAFALDYPVSIVQLKNPKPNRFKNTYRAYSVGPSFSNDDIDSLQVGDPRWTSEIKQHYLVQHPDYRYKDLALEITKEITAPVKKMRALTDHLTRTAIYTLTPNHDTKPTDDPVAPFLFGDHRGYCVHFAHAVVYMARALGIPARVATGYLTDLSQAKDGHILLRMSDRHAWAEAFVTGIGWIPFDVQPEQVESHADTQVDAKLLEELMGILEPGEEILPDSSFKDEAGLADRDDAWRPSTSQVLWFLSLLLVLSISSKLILRLRWRFTSSPLRKLRWGYVSLASTLYDMGLSRSEGETRSEFSSRTPHQLLNEVSSLLIRSTYQKSSSLTLSEVNTTLSKARSDILRLPVTRQLRAALNPAATLRFLGGGRW
jgi:hypothetical protein